MTRLYRIILNPSLHCLASLPSPPYISKLYINKSLYGGRGGDLASASVVKEIFMVDVIEFVDKDEVVGIGSS